ncbi:MAG TPA: class I SAM-dependent methyltransferase, partial [Albitalea sp.]|nr:class I SAM-dependent methyltransferase [Albitalea sp.]
MTASSTFVAADGDGYERVMGRWSQRLAVPFLDFAGSAGSERVLDVGCGTGHLARLVAARSPASRVTGVDLSPIYIDHA